MRPEEALGALIRSDQAIVIGDTQQLPPTNFFDKVVEDTMIESEDPDVPRVGEMESILHQSGVVSRQSGLPGTTGASMSH